MFATKPLVLPGVYCLWWFLIASKDKYELLHSSHTLGTAGILFVICTDSG